MFSYLIITQACQEIFKPYFINEETKDQRSFIAYPASHSKRVTDPGLKFRSDFKAIAS